MSQGTDELEGELTFRHGESADRRHSLFPSGDRHGAGGRCDRGRWRQRMQPFSAEEIMLRFACKKGIAGIVVDGCLRDLDGKNVAFLGSYSELYH